MQKVNKSIILSLLCNLFHYYAFSIYVFSAVILSSIFFHTDNDKLTKILGLLTFSIPFLARPLGSIIFGHIGDKHGRKKALMCSLVAIAVATMCIGLIPSCEQIGGLSSVLLIMCLIVQGACIGGQYTGALVYIQELVSKKYTTFACSLMISMGFLGVLLGTLTSFMFDDVTHLTWGWRLPFLLCAAIGMALYIFMMRMEETPAFMESKEKASVDQIPLLDIIKNYKKPLISAIFISSITVSMLYLTTVYIANFSIENIGVSEINPLRFVLLMQTFCMLLIPVMGFVADKLGNEQLLKLTSTLLIVTPVFIFYYMFTSSTLWAFIIGALILCVYGSMYAGAGPAYLSEKFPVIGRYSGMGLGISIGEGFFGGLTPVICVALQESFGSKIAPAYFVVLLGLLSFVGILIPSLEKRSLKLKQERNSVAG